MADPTDFVSMSLESEPLGRVHPAPQEASTSLNDHIQGIIAYRDRRDDSMRCHVDYRYRV